MVALRQGTVAAAGDPRVLLDALINRFDKVGKVEEVAGFLGLEVLLNEKPAEYNEVTISTRWESKEALQGWTAATPFVNRIPTGRHRNTSFPMPFPFMRSKSSAIQSARKLQLCL